VGCDPPAGVPIAWPGIPETAISPGASALAERITTTLEQFAQPAVRIIPIVMRITTTSV